MGYLKQYTYIFKFNFVFANGIFKIYLSIALLTDSLRHIFCSKKNWLARESETCQQNWQGWSILRTISIYPVSLIISAVLLFCGFLLGFESIAGFALGAMKILLKLIRTALLPLMPIMIIQNRQCYWSGKSSFGCIHMYF